MTKGKRRIEMFYAIRAPRKKVFEALTNPQTLNRWFTDSARLEPKKGGGYAFRWEGGYHHEGEVLEYRANRSLILGWPQNGTATRVAFWLTSQKGVTVVRFRQTGLPRELSREVNFLGLYAGWVFYLAHLRALLETGRDLRHPLDRYW